MGPLKLELKSKELEAIREYLKYEERRVIRRANILNCLHLGYTSGDIALILNVDSKTVTNVGNAYLEEGLESALYDDERCGRPIDFDDDDKSRIVAMVCSDPPKGYYRWTLDLIVEESKKREIVDDISREEIRIILKEHDLKPWQEKMWCIGELDDEYIEKMEDVLDVYKRTYDPRKPVVCVDEKPVPLISDTKERITPQKPGEVLKKDYEYERNGSVNVFCGVEPKVGVYINKVTENRNGQEFTKFLMDIEKRYDYAEKIILVMDNLSTHTDQVIIKSIGEEAGNLLLSRFEFHYTPKHGSWLNQAEIAIGMYSRQCLGDGRVGSYEDLRDKTKEWNKKANQKATIINWRFNKNKARKSFGYKLDYVDAEKLI
ncbi:MAG: IS630 family transposase [Oligoflexia bacterium]|nr:IS630 family transposase [Oligoflexia bacterium]